MVAGEVKALAAQTSRATTNVTESVQAIQTGSQAAADVMDAVTDTINRVSENQTAIAAAVEQQTATTQEIGRNTAQAAQGSSELADNVERLVSAVRASAYAGAQARTIAGDLAGLEETLEGALARYQFVPAERAETETSNGITEAKVENGVVIIENSVFGTGLNQLSYGEHWRHSNANVEGGDTNSYCSIPGDAVTLRFRGRQVKLYGICESNHGIALISVDGGPEEVGDEFAPSRTSKLVWQSGQLSDGEHTVVLRVSGDRNPQSTYNWTTVDRFEVTL